MLDMMGGFRYSVVDYIKRFKPSIEALDCPAPFLKICVYF